MPPKSHHVAVLGLGLIGQRLLGIFHQSESFTIVGGWDSKAAARVKSAELYPYADFERPAEQLIQDKAVDLVYIGVPPKAHAGYVKAALAAGKAIFCEKPLGIDVSESRELVTKVMASGLPQAVNFVYGTSRSATVIERAIAAGAVGALASIEVRVHHGLWPRSWQAAADWLAFREEGGFTREVLSHFLYLIERLVGPAQLVAHDVRYPPDPRLCETHLTARLVCGDVPVQIIGSTGGAGPDEVIFTLRGAKRSYRIDNWYTLSMTEGGDWVAQDLTLVDPRADTTARQVDNLAGMLSGRPHSMPSFAAALRVQELVEAMLRSN